MGDFNEKYEKVGALWKKQGTNGEYWSGMVKNSGEEKRVIIFKNKKAKDTHPDYQIFSERENPQTGEPDHKPEIVKNDDGLPF